MNAHAQVKTKATSVTELPGGSPISGLLQRKCACGGSSGMAGECDECGGEKLNLQRSAADHAAPASVPPIVNEVLRSPGRPLEVSTRGFFEARFGHDFSQVRVHTDGRAAESARAVSALAYTMGQHIVFEEGQYSTRSTPGQRLLAHELAHVTQQGQLHQIPSRIAVGRTDSHLETEADRISLQIISAGKSERRLQTQGSLTPQLQRQPRPRQGGTREATVTVRWSEDPGEFIDRLITALRQSAEFRGIDPGEYRSYRQGEVSFPETVEAFQYARRHSGFKEGKRIKVTVSADYNRSREFHDSDLSNFNISMAEKPAAEPAAGKASAPDTTTPGTIKTPGPAPTASPSPPGSCRTVPKSDEAPAARVHREAGETACVMATLLLDAYKQNHPGITITLTFDGRGLQYPNFAVDRETREREPGEVPFSYAQALSVATAEVDLLVPFGPGELTVYFSFVDGLHAQRTDHRALSEPAPPPPPPPAAEMEELSEECDPEDVTYGECLAQDREGRYKEAIQKAGEYADAVYNPFATGGGDEAGILGKIPYFGRAPRLYKASKRLRAARIKVPRVLEHRGLGSSAEKLDPDIMTSVLEYRSSPHGSKRANFKRNFAAARVRLETGETKIIKSLNVAKGTHSEEEILGVLVDEIKKTGKKVKVEQVFSERMPCKNCWRGIILKHFGEDTNIFYFIGYSKDRATALRNLYY